MNATEVIAYAGNADIYCTDCAFFTHSEDGWQAIFCGAEVDSPQHCASCHDFIDGHTLTDEGRSYVSRAILHYIQTDYSKPPYEWLDMAEISADIYDALRSLPHLAINWHGGQSTKLYQLQSSGLKEATLEDVRDAIDELQKAYEEASGVEDTNSELDNVESTLYDLQNF